MSDQPKPIQLDTESEWLTFEIHGHSFSVEIFEANDILAENDRKYLNDPDACLDCNHEFIRIGDDRKKRPLTCPKCQSENVFPSQRFLDGVAEILISRWKAPRCSRSEAGAFYNAVVDAAEAKKKPSQTQPESHSSTEGSTHEDGASQPAEPG